ncbi:MAG: class I mannose-6-phosphate isomerase [Tepidisphaeraceae bacterium]
MTSKTPLYPLKFKPRFIEKIWGGRELARVANKSIPDNKLIGESWELFDFPPGAVGADGIAPEDVAGEWTSSKVSNGPLAGTSLHSILLLRGDELLGRATPVTTPHGPQFPLLVKFLDANQDLSVQVHPPMSYAASHPGAHLKNECWHVLSHKPDARILIGTKSGTDRAMFEASIEAGACESLLNAVKVQTGDTFYLPSGTVHALGAGIVAAEVQTPSDTTYRVFDFNRIDAGTGKPRKLHIAEALECIDFTTDPKKSWTPPGEGEAVIVMAPQFKLLRRDAQPGETPTVYSRVRVMTVLQGSGVLRCAKEDIDDVPYSVGDTILIPACCPAIVVPETYTRWLETHLPE